MVHAHHPGATMTRFSTCLQDGHTQEGADQGRTSVWNLSLLAADQDHAQGWRGHRSMVGPRCAGSQSPLHPPQGQRRCQVRDHGRHLDHRGAIRNRPRTRPVPSSYGAGSVLIAVPATPPPAAPPVAGVSIVTTLVPAPAVYVHCRLQGLSRIADRGAGTRGSHCPRCTKQPNACGRNDCNQNATHYVPPFVHHGRRYLTNPPHLSASMRELNQSTGSFAWR
jgi:hypothetical protein